MPERWRRNVENVFHGDIQAIIQQRPDLRPKHYRLRATWTDANLNVIAHLANAKLVGGMRSQGQTDHEVDQVLVWRRQQWPRWGLV